jgi:hypothetical protein
MQINKVTKPTKYVFDIYENKGDEYVFIKQVTIKHNLIYKRFKNQKKLICINYFIPIERMQRKYKFPYEIELC